MLADFRSQLISIIEQSLNDYNPKEKYPTVDLEIPTDKQHGDFSCNIALKLAKSFRKPPVELASVLCGVIQKRIKVNRLNNKISNVEVKKPGFINFFLAAEAHYSILYQVFQEGEHYGCSHFGQGRKIQIEFVSANPTGPLSVAHARQAAVGDALTNILNGIGFDVKKEFYVNDEGNQINILGQSIQYRALEILGEAIEFPQEGYQGEYIKDIAKEFIDDHRIRNVSQLKAHPFSIFARYGVDYLLAVIKQELKDFGVHFDIWSHQSKIATPQAIKDVLAFLGEKGFLYEKDGALWFKSTDFGDDKDRVVEKSDGSYTYFTPDIVYHKNKFGRGFEKVINIWGPDHHGYIPRLRAAVEALGKDREALEILIVQLATIYREGKPISMSTRRGQYISLQEVIEEVGVDAARFFFLMRHIDAHLDFDLELAKKQTPENPVYYIQYAHARICSVIEKAQEAHLEPQQSGLTLLKQEEEVDLIKKIGLFPATLMVCYKQLDPFALVSYLQEIATYFHKFYDQHRVVDTDDLNLSKERLALIDATRIAIANGLRLLGVSVPKRM